MDHSAFIIDGKKARDHYTGILVDRVKNLSHVPCLAIIQVGARTDSDAFIQAKKSFAKKIGAKELHIQLPENVSEEEVLATVEKYNNDSSVQGIIVQLPLPKHLNADTIINRISPAKDTDGLTPGSPWTPATARGIKELLDFYSIPLSGKKVTVLGQSKLVGIPIAQMCRNNGASVTVCDSKTANVPEKARGSDILIVAIGKPELVDESYVTAGQVVIDVGITRVDERDLRGDVNFDRVKNIVEKITPVPGGVGQMTVLALFENLVDACYNTK